MLFPKLSGKKATQVIIDDIFKDDNTIFNEWTEAVYTTGRILEVALKYDCHLVGVGWRNDLFPHSSKIPKDWWYHNLFVEGDIKGKWPNAWAIAHDAKVGNRSGSKGFSPIQVDHLDRGVFQYINEVWVCIERPD